MEFITIICTEQTSAVSAQLLINESLGHPFQTMWSTATSLLVKCVSLYINKSITIDNNNNNNNNNNSCSSKM